MRRIIYSISNKLGGTFHPLRIAILLLISVLICLLAFTSLMFYSLVSESQYSIRGLDVKQENTTIHATWKDAGSKGYAICLLGKRMRPKIYYSKKPECIIQPKELDKKYAIIVFAKNPSGGLSAAKADSVSTRKLRQKIYTGKPMYAGIKGHTTDLNVSAHGRIHFTSSNEDIVRVSKKGTVSFLEEGDAYIRMSVDEGPLYKGARGSLKVKAYPDKLKTPVVSANNDSDQTASIHWEPVEYAKSYSIEKYDPVKGVYGQIAELDKDTTSVSYVRDQATYKVKATAVIEGETVESDLSEEIKVNSTAVEAETYTRSHNLGTLDLSTLYVVAKISGSGGANVPQSFSHVGEDYVVTFVDKAGRKGALVSYGGTTGNHLGTTKITGMGHANGSTFNPNTGKIYTVKTHKKIWSPSCTTYDLDNACSKDTFNLPKNTSGIAYDESNNKYYLSKGNEIYVTDTDFNVEKFLWKSIRYNHAQDIGAYNGVVLVCTWVSGNESYIDLYRTSDGAYLGSYYVPIGEIESCFVEVDYEKNEKHLVILMNNGKKVGDCILKTRDPIVIP